MLAGHTGKYGRFEIERKFVLKSVPEQFREFHDLHDTYLPDSSLRLRIARSANGEIISRNLTQKNKAPGLDPSVSIMTSLHLSESDLAALMPVKGAVIEKRRYFVETENNRIAVDVFKGKLEGLVLAEVEFKTDTDRDAYSAPEGWVEVTGRQDYSCGYMAFHPHQLPII